MGTTGADPQIEFWLTVGLVGVIVAVFLLFFWGWPMGGDPSDNKRPGGGGPDDGAGI